MSALAATGRWYAQLLSDCNPPTVQDLIQRPAWMAQAACKGMGTDAWFPTLGESLEPARAVCRGCDVRRECREFAIDSREILQGVWGGLSERERRDRRAWRRESA